MRIGGPAPFNLTGSYPIALPGGGYCYIPQGNWLISPGATTVIQWQDPVALAWHGLTGASSSSYNGGVPISVDGSNYRLINFTSTVTGATIGTAGTGGTNGIGPTQTGTTLSFAAAPAGGQTAKGYVIIGGAVGTAGGSATVTQGGSGFLVAPLILIDPPPAGGIQATAVAAITSAGVLNTVTMVNPGAGYTTVPNFYVVPQFLDYPGAPTPIQPTPPFPPPGQIAVMPPGIWASNGLQPSFPFSAGALVTGPALAASGAQTGIVVTESGAGYTAAPAITFTGGTLGGTPTATATFGGTGANDTSFLQAFINE